MNRASKSRLRDALRERFAELREIKSGTWLTRALKKLLQKHVRTANADFFSKKYPGLDREKVAQRLIQNSAHHAGLAGVTAATAITAAELTAPESGGVSLGAAGAAFLGELTTTTYIQLKMIYDVSIVLDARLDPADPEDMTTMFWYALGIQKWQEIANAALTEGPKTTKYLARKALRFRGLRKGLQHALGRFGGRQLARKLTEKAFLRLIVPGLNLPIAYWANKRFTQRLGRIAINRLKHRAVVAGTVNSLLPEMRRVQILALPIIFHIGIAPEMEAVSSRAIEMQDTVTRRLKITAAEEEIIFQLIELPFSKFLQGLGSPAGPLESDSLGDLAIIAHVLSESPTESRLRLGKFFKTCSKPLDKNRVESFKARLQ